MKTYDRDSILRTGGVQKIARGLANEIDPLFHAAGHVEQEHQIERLAGLRHIDDLSLSAVFVNREVRRPQVGNRAPIAIRDADIDAH